MTSPSKYELFLSMAKREVENVLMSPGVDNILGSFGIKNKSILKLGLEMAESYVKDDPKIKAFIESIISKDKTIDVSTDILKEDMGAKIDKFSERLKERLKEEAKNAET